MNYQFFKLTEKQLEQFSALKEAGKTSKHGPLALDEKVAMHKHGNAAMYLVKGVAEFYGTAVKKVLGTGKGINAVLVSAGQEHGWLSRFAGTEIDQVFGASLVNRLIAAV